MQISKRLKTALKILGYSAFSTFFFILFFIYTFPIDVIINNLLRNAQNTSGYIINPEKTYMSIFPPGVTFENIKIAKIQIGDAAPSKPVALDKLTLWGALWTLSGESPSFRFSASGFGGSFSGKASFDKPKASLNIDFSASELNMTPLSNAFGLSDKVPVSGQFSGDVELLWSMNNPSNTNGEIKLEFQNLAVGPTENPVTIPKITLGDVKAELSVVQGRMLVRRWDTKSKEINSEIVGSLNIAKNFAEWRYNLMYRFKIDGPLKEETAVKALLQLANQAKAKDDFFYYRITGTYASPNYTPCSTCQRQWDIEKQANQKKPEDKKKEEKKEELKKPEPPKKK